MDLLTKEDLGVLLEKRGQNLVSIFMPTFRTGLAAEENPLRLGALLSAAEERLSEQGMNAARAERLLESARDLLEDLEFWRQPEDGLAVFLAPDGFLRHYRAPLLFDERVVVGAHFHIKPLLPIFTGEGHFYMLLLGRQEVRLLHGTREDLRDVALEGVPDALAKLLRPGSARRALAGSGVRGAGNAPLEGESPTLRDRLHEVDRSVGELLQEEPVPVILSGARDVLTVYREAAVLPTVVEEMIFADPGAANLGQLHARAWEILQDRHGRQRERAAREYRRLQARGSDRATNDIEEIVRAACEGRVQTLFVAVHSQLWGRYDPQSNRVEEHSSREGDDEDLLDVAAVYTLIHDGTVFASGAEAVPDPMPVAAILKDET